MNFLCSVLPTNAFENFVKQKINIYGGNIDRKPKHFSKIQIFTSKNQKMGACFSGIYKN